MRHHNDAPSESDLADARGDYLRDERKDDDLGNDVASAKHEANKLRIERDEVAATVEALKSEMDEASFNTGRIVGRLASLLEDWKNAAVAWEGAMFIVCTDHGLPLDEMSGDARRGCERAEMISSIARASEEAT